MEEREVGVFLLPLLQKAGGLAAPLRQGCHSVWGLSLGSLKVPGLLLCHPTSPGPVGVKPSPSYSGFWPAHSLLMVS